MTKQEKIREELPKLLERVWYGEDYDNVWHELTKVALAYLDSEDVVIKVERALPEIYTRDEESLDPEDYQFLKGMRFILNAGYVATMPLIDKEVKREDTA